MDWTAIICAIIGAGGFSAAFLIVEKKSGAAIDNALKICQDAINRAEALTDKYKALADEYQENEAKTQARLEAKEVELMNQIKINSSLHHKMDDAHTRCAVLELTHCELALTCPNKRPPLTDTAKRYLEQTAPAHGNDK